MGQLEMHGECIITRNDKGVLIEYPEFNSNCLKRLGTRRYQLYQVAAVAAVKKQFPEVRKEEMIEWATGLKLEASHLCRFSQLTYQPLPDGTVYELPLTSEVKPCFCIDHMFLEPDQVNRSRIRCTGGTDCPHVPKCILVEPFN